MRQIYLELAAAVAVPLAAYTALRLGPDPMLMVPHGHFVVVGGVSLLAAILAGAVSWAAARGRNLEVTFLALAFFSLAGFFTVHGLTTPGVLMGPNATVGVAAFLSLGSAAVFLFLATVPGDAPLLRWLGAHRGLLMLLWAVLVLVFAVSALLVPHLWDWWGNSYGGYAESPEPSTQRFFDWLVEEHGWLVVGLSSVAGLACVRFSRAFRYARLPLQRVLGLASAWIMAAILIAGTATTWNASWWLYHVLMLAAVVAMLAGLLRHGAASGSFVQRLQALATADPFAQLEQGLSPGLAGLVAATEIRDPYTAGHGERVARLAVQIGQQLGLPPEALRALGQGGWIHDVGKIGVPDAVLNKPGALVPEERALIEDHAEAGYRIARRIGSLGDELDAIRHHHERWDGRGYPASLRGEEIPLTARVLAVADVYDALTSSRSYREAWQRPQALEFIRSGAGAQFDAACVAALERVLGVAAFEGPQPRGAASSAPTPSR